MRNLRGLSAVVFLAFVTLVSPAPAQSQTSVEQELDEAKVLYRDGHLDEAVAALRSIIPRLNAIQDLQRRRTQLADAHFHLGLSYLAMRDDPGALENFRQVVALDPDRALDPDVYSPRVLALFDRARADVMANPTEKRPDERLHPPEATARTEPAPPSRTWVQVLPGTQVRIWLSGASSVVEGRLLNLDDGGLMVLSGANQNLSFSRHSVSKLQVLKGQKGHWLAGAIAGTILGVAIGAAETPGCTVNDGCYTRAENMAYDGLGAGLIGALVGALIKTDQWADVPLLLPPTQAKGSAAKRGVAVTFAWRF